MEWPQTTCTVVRVFPEVAYVGGWWVVLGVVGGAAVETLFIKISGAFTGVYVSLWCLCRMTGTKWNLRRRIRGNTAPNPRPRGLLAFCFHLSDENGVCLCCCLFLILSEIDCADGVQTVYLVSYKMKYHEFTIQDERFACEKQMAFMSCLAPCGHELLELLMFFLSTNSDPLHQLCWATTLWVVHLAFYERTYFLFLFFIFQATSERKT